MKKTSPRSHDWSPFRADERPVERFPQHGRYRLALAYANTYHVAMSSLGYLQIHRLVNERSGTTCERAMLPDEPERWRDSNTKLVTIESGRPVSEFDVIGISHAYELESTGIVSHRAVYFR